MKKKIFTIVSLILLLQNVFIFSFAQDEQVNADLTPGNEIRTTLIYKNEPLSNVIKDLANKFNVDIVLTDKVSQSITCNVRDVSVEDALNLILCGTSLDFTKHNTKESTYIVFKTDKPNCRAGKESKMFKLTNL